MARKVCDIIGELADREAIRDTFARYSRGVDRVDEDLLCAVYWEDATDNHVDYVGDAPGFIAFILPVLRSMDQTSHMTGNMLIELVGTTAKVETYFHAFHRIPGEDGVRGDLVVGGRYLDRMEKRNDEWRIANRHVMVDWYRSHDDSADWSNGFRGVDIAPGARKPYDRSYQLFSS